MTAILAFALVASAGLMLTGLLLRSDPRVMQALQRLGDPRAGHRRGSALLVTLGRALPRRIRESSVTRLREAAPPQREAVLGWKVILASTGLAAGASAGWDGGSIAVAVVLAVAGFRFPDFVLARRATINRHKMEAGVPEVVDLVALSVAAGLTPRLALDRVTDLLQGRLRDELGAARREVALGKPWREALAALAQRTGLRELSRVALVLERTERLGTPVSEQLRSLARQVRAEHRAADEERARRAPVLMLFPLVFLILPAFVLAAVAPAVLVATRGIP